VRGERRTRERTVIHCLIALASAVIALNLIVYL
jgi:hypothetical protein